MRASPITTTITHGAPPRGEALVFDLAFMGLNFAIPQAMVASSGFPPGVQESNIMVRRYWILTALSCCGCSPPPPSGDGLLPLRVGAVWIRESLRAIPPPQATILRGFEADYHGGGKLTVDLYETKAPGTAFE